MKLKENDQIINVADGQVYTVKSVQDNMVLVERDSNIHEMAISDVVKIEK